MEQKQKYSAHIVLRHNNEDISLYFSGLSKREAETVHRIMEKNYSHITSSAAVTRYGWEVKE